MFDSSMDICYRLDEFWIRKHLPSLIVSWPNSALGDFGDFGVSFVATVAGRYTRRGGPRLSVRRAPNCADARTMRYLLCNAAPQ